MKKLNKFETAIMDSIISENKSKFSFLEKQYSQLNVKSRENTGVGIYINFQLIKKNKFKDINTLLSSSKTLSIPGFENELTYILDIKDGKINFLEIVTNGKDQFDLEKAIDEFNLS